MVKRKTKSSALGDDPLAWIASENEAKGKAIKKAKNKKTKRKKAKVKTNQKGKIQKEKIQKEKIQKEKIQKEKIKAGKSVAERDHEGKQADKQGHNSGQDADIDKQNSDETSLVLGSIITINDAQAMYTQLNSMLESKQDITIDASAVEMLDTAILQLLLAFVNKIRAQNREVVWIKPSEEMINRATTLNLQAGLGLDGAT